MAVAPRTEAAQLYASSHPPPDGLPLLRKREWTLTAILRTALAEHVLVATIHRIRQRQAETFERSLLAGAHRQRRALEDRIRPTTRRWHQLFGRHDLVDQTPAVGIVSGHRRAGQQHTHRDLEWQLADDTMDATV